jgi:hypothetical protein
MVLINDGEYFPLGLVLATIPGGNELNKRERIREAAEDVSFETFHAFWLALISPERGVDARQIEGAKNLCRFLALRKTPQSSSRATADTLIQMAIILLERATSGKD